MLIAWLTLQRELTGRFHEPLTSTAVCTCVSNVASASHVWPCFGSFVQIIYPFVCWLLT
jgi:hypothetical protein